MIVPPASHFILALNSSVGDNNNQCLYIFFEWLFTKKILINEKIRVTLHLYIIIIETKDLLDSIWVITLL